MKFIYDASGNNETGHFFAIDTLSGKKLTIPFWGVQKKYIHNRFYCKMMVQRLVKEHGLKIYNIQTGWRLEYCFSSGNGIDTGIDIKFKGNQKV